VLGARATHTITANIYQLHPYLEHVAGQSLREIGTQAKQGVHQASIREAGDVICGSNMWGFV